MATGATEMTDGGSETATESDAERDDQSGEPLTLSSTPSPEQEAETVSSAEPVSDEVVSDGEDDNGENPAAEEGSSPEQSTISAEADGFGEVGATGRYWDVPLEPPPGASEALAAYIVMADTAVQTAVDLLGRGMPELPPNVEDLLTPDVHERLGKGAADEAYEATLEDVDSRQAELLEMDIRVVDSAIVMAHTEDRTLSTIIAIVEEVQGVLKAAGSGDLTPEVEIKLMDLIADALEVIYEKVTAVADLSAEVAGGGGEDAGSGSSGNTTIPAAAAAGGGGGNGLGSLLGMAPMALMSLMPLANMLPNVLEQLREEEEERAEQAPADEPAPPPIDPTQPPGATPVPAAQPGTPTPENAPTTGIPA